jgi:formylglycine-generating enzyme required for sulfatase activity
MVAMSALLAGRSVCFAQDAKPWEQAGTQAGQEMTGPDGEKMVWVPAGEFDMGQEGVATPVHHVRISRGFWLGKCPVTNAQYQQYCEDTGVDFPQDSDEGDNHPVLFVNGIEAQAYCTTYGLSLPTEAQWEYAARGAEGRVYPWGNQWDEEKCCNSACRPPRGMTFPVGSFPDGAAWCGALDMAGNVWQWCQDWYDAKYYANSPDTDPPGPGNGKYRVLRGGCWCSSSDHCRSAVRDDSSLTGRSSYFGFRCCKTP